MNEMMLRWAAFCFRCQPDKLMKWKGNLGVLQDGVMAEEKMRKENEDTSENIWTEWMANWRQTEEAAITETRDATTIRG